MTPDDHHSTTGIGSGDDARSRSPRRRALLVGLLIGLASGGAGAAAGAAALPSVDEMRRMSAEELGVDPDVLDLPLVASIVDAMTERVEDRLVDEVRRSVAVAVGASAAVAVAGVAVATLVERRPR
jgi:ABC-type Fe3+ transport system permease subunit